MIHPYQEGALFVDQDVSGDAHLAFENFITLLEKGCIWGKISPLEFLALGIRNHKCKALEN